MVVYLAENCETAWEAEVSDLGAGAGRVICPECSGDGNWGKFAPEIVGPDCRCVDCKAGFQMVSI